MTMTRPGLLQLGKLSPWLESQLEQDFAVCRHFELDDPDGWVAAHGASIGAVATGGNIGIPSDLMLRLPNLGVVAVNGVGVDKVDLNLARDRGVSVTTTRGILSEDVADLAVVLTIDVLRNITGADAYVRAGKWPGGEWPLARTVTGRTFGIVGLGEIGLALAARLSPFGKVLYTGPREKPVSYDYVPDLVELARVCDVLLLTCSATPANAGMIDRAVLEALGPSGYLVNVARGSLVDEPVLIEMLRSGGIAGAGLDVFRNEPHAPGELFDLPNVVLTPHVASATVETRQRMAESVIASLREWLADAPLANAVV
ncbi:2-hydroxyacid dehydrogenase [Novosphingobium flavum]|uniref:2-hydroxyacid dehydrogenase n=1 Tax=Novosphingobium flavum TaxID=1778672 RepID=A0A7X1KL71_9SPHN|nr:2-hydroxyacid dehydrogenase [Novosphingobium flavum]MBC2664935.1 2-hydroxyacid dehydrogenase [Novosphingobium flavum]